MKVTKLGHCCLLIEHAGVKIMTDPGMFTTEKHEAVTGIGIVLITHEHADHFHADSLKKVLQKNPDASVLCNSSVGAILSKEGVAHRVVDDGKEDEEKGVAIEGHGSIHATIHTSLPQMYNTGFFIAEKLWYPGDAFTDPKRPIDILALPVAGPWMKIAEAIDYAIALKPRLAFPVHDGIMNPVLINSGSFLYKTPSTILEPQRIQFLPLDLDKEYDLA